MALLQAHGILCGALCTPEGKKVDCVGEITGRAESGDVLGRECTASLLSLYSETERQLGSGDCEFRPLLPDDEESLERRSEALGAWCSGFLLGLSLGGVTDLATLPADSREIIEDLNQFAGIRPSAIEDEAEEVAYAELVEYIRVGVMLINDELHGSGQASASRNMH